MARSRHHPAVVASFRTTHLPRRRTADRLLALTEREREALVLMGRGRNNQEIATDLVVTEATVRTYVGHTFDKLHLRDRAAAIVLAFDHGPVAPAD